MPLPELEAQRVKRVLDRFCDRVPPHVRSEVWYTYLTRGNAVTVTENRPYFLDRKRTTEHPFARLRYDPLTGRWALWSRDRNRRWHRYLGFESVTLEAALAEINRDPTGIFFG